MRSSLWIMLSLLLCALPLQANEQKTPPKPALSEAYVEGRITSLDRLLNSSAGAKRLEESGNTEAQARQQQAREALKRAEEALGDSDLNKADQELSEATRLMFEAIRMIGSGDK